MNYPYKVELWLRGHKEEEYAVDAPNELIAITLVLGNNQNGLEHCLCDTGAELKVYRNDVPRDLIEFPDVAQTNPNSLNDPQSELRDQIQIGSNEWLDKSEEINRYKPLEL